MLISLLFAALVAEGVLRFSMSRAPWDVKQMNHQKIFCEYDSLLGWRKIPNFSGFHVQPEYKVLENFNSKGLRGPEYSYEKRDNEYRVLILGDSFAEGYTVEFNQLFSEVLKSLLNENSHQEYYEVINSGTGGYSTDQELLFFQTEGKKYDPDLTILLFTDNDPWYNNQPKYTHGYKPLFKLIDGKLTLTNVPTPKPDTTHSQHANVASRNTLFRRTKDWLNYNSYLYTTIRGRIENSYRLFALAKKLGLTEPDRSLEIPALYGVYLKKYNNAIRRAWETTESIINTLKEETDSSGSDLLIFYVPSRASIYPDYRSGTERKYRLSEKDWDIELVGRQLSEICKRNDIDLINTTHRFKTEAEQLNKSGKRLYYVIDGHWNVNGHRLAGRILAEYIEERNYLQISNHTGSGF